jgi:hypothetical protein
MGSTVLANITHLSLNGSLAGRHFRRRTSIRAHPAAAARSGVKRSRILAGQSGLSLRASRDASALVGNSSKGSIRKRQVEHSFDIYHDQATSAPSSRIDMRIIWIM